MEWLSSLGEYAALAVPVVIAVANLITAFIDESKVNKYVKPFVSFLNFLAVNVGKNKNATDVDNVDVAKK